MPGIGEAVSGDGRTGRDGLVSDSKVRSKDKASGMGAVLVLAMALAPPPPPVLY